jgi:transcriptional regulator with XRE-family HTH domain
MKAQKDKSIYRILGQELRKRTDAKGRYEILPFPQTIRRLREEKKLTGVALCRLAGDLDPRTLTAVEKGRIKNPSMKTLASVSRGLGVSIGDLFRQCEKELDRHLYLGSQKGAFQMDFSWCGVKMVSFTPFIEDFFCGKLILSPQRRVDETLLKHPRPFFISTLIGRLEITVEEKLFDLKEGENLFFNGMLKHSFYNPLHRESVLLMVTAPSFL